MSNSLSLYTIEDGLAELLVAREELLAEHRRMADNVPALGPSQESRDELAQIEKALAEYLTLEVRKVDNYHRFLASAKETAAAARAEGNAMLARAKRLEEAAAHLKARALDVMAVAGKKRIDGTAGRYLLRKANGGIAPLDIQSIDLLPDEFIDVTMRFPKSALAEINAVLAVSASPDFADWAGKIVGVEPANARIRAALAAGLNIPGAHLTERGEHLEVK